MKTEFTPGPWELSPDNNWECGITTTSDDQFIEASTQSLDGFYEMTANARLISQAPELFELCVFIAHKECWQWAYDIISKVVGANVTLSDVDELYKSYNKK